MGCGYWQDGLMYSSRLTNQTPIACADMEAGEGRRADSRMGCRHGCKMRDPQGPVASAMRHGDQPSPREGSWCGSHDAFPWLGSISQRVRFLTPSARLMTTQNPVCAGAAVAAWGLVRTAAAAGSSLVPKSHCTAIDGLRAHLTLIRTSTVAAAVDYPGEP
jgi:hypothetical protein